MALLQQFMGPDVQSVLLKTAETTLLSIKFDNRNRSQTFDKFVSRLREAFEDMLINRSLIVCSILKNYFVSTVGLIGLNLTDDGRTYRIPTPPWIAVLWECVEAVDVVGVAAHQCAPQLEEVSLVLHLLGEQISRVDCTRDMDGLHFTKADGLTDGTLADVELSHVAGHRL